MDHKSHRWQRQQQEAQAAAESDDALTAAAAKDSLRTADEEEKAKIQNDLRILTERLSRLNDNLARKIASRNEYDKTIQETEGAYAKVRPLPLLPSHLATRPPIPSYPRGRLGELISAEADLRDVPRAAAHAEPYSPLALLATDHGELANTAACAQA